MGTNFIAIAFVLWHLVLGTARVLSILLWEGGRELGIALLVGALFSFGSFLAQFWSQAASTGTASLRRSSGERFMAGRASG